MAARSGHTTNETMRTAAQTAHEPAMAEATSGRSSGGSRPDSRGVALTSVTSDDSDAGSDADSLDRPLDFRAVYDQWFTPVCRWLRALGGPSSDVEDLAQEVFVIVRRKLDGFDGGNVGGWLYRITERVAANARRRAWFRHLFKGRAADHALDDLHEHRAGPVEQLERKEAERELYRLLDRMSEKRRTALILSEIEGLSGDEIAELQGIPVATARTRLFHARKEFLELAGQLRRGEL